ncbi:ArnT family glycosyltransferase [Pseudoalteromonas xiamenensis]
MFNKISEDTWVKLIFAALVLALIAGLGLRFPWPADEPRFAQIAREMLMSGQWLFPTRAGEFYPDKPPVFMWLISVSYLITQHFKIAFLLPSALAGLGVAYLVYDITKRLYDRKTAITALLILIICPQFLLQAKAAQIDMVLCFFTTIGCYGLIRHYILGPNNKWLYLAFIAMAIGVMTKGVGFLPMLMLIPLALWFKNTPTRKSWKWQNWLGVVLFFVTLACWLGPMLYQVNVLQTPELIAYKNNILFKQTAERYANAWHHQEPWHYFIVKVIPMMWFPALAVIVFAWKECVALFKSQPIFRVLITWVLFVLLFFSISTGKRGVYIFPALPMFSIVVAVVWHKIERENIRHWIRRVLFGFAGLVTFLLFAIAFVIVFKPQLLEKKHGDYLPLLNELVPFIAIMAALLVLLLVKLRKSDAFQALAGITLVVWLAVGFVVWPTADSYRTPDVIMEKAQTIMPNDGELGLVRFKEQFLMFASKPITHFSYLANEKTQFQRAWQWVFAKPNRFILVSDEEPWFCFNKNNAIELGQAHRRTWYLLSHDQIESTCDTPDTMKTYQFVPNSEVVF